MFIGNLEPLITCAIGVWFANRVSMTYLFIVATVELDGARKNVGGFAKTLIGLYEL